MLNKVPLLSNYGILFIMHCTLSHLMKEKQTLSLSLKTKNVNSGITPEGSAVLIVEHGVRNPGYCMSSLFS